ncbi:MAG TPA: hypothetical protein VJH94_00050 [Candidatus Paceibacterota bacterium]
MKTIACLGSGSGAPGDAMYDAMVEVGRLLVKRGYRVATGGFGGAGMEAPVRGAKEAGGETLGYTMLDKPGNSFLDIDVPCSTLLIPGGGVVTLNSVEEQYGLRLGRLLEADGFIIAAYGGPGTFAELMAIINLNYKIWKERPKRFTILNPAYGEGWDVHMCDWLNKWGVFPKEVAPLFIPSQTPRQAVEWVCPDGEM